MRKCPQCGKELDNGVKFCTNFGAPMSDAEPEKTEFASVETDIEAKSVPPQREQATQRQVSTAEKKSIDFTLFDKCFWILYVVVGAFAYLGIELGNIYALNASADFIVFLGVFSILSAIGFIVIAIFRKIATAKEGEADRNKHALRDNICLAVSIVIFTYVIIGTIGLFNIAHTIGEAFRYGIV